jgi:7,8-dihydropterin-6-yl-methyl-4-(beta-D-ribofuranosyl)aminobenzene 5'-phosphate synthase
MTKLGIAPKSIDAVILSHKHRDHVGGLASFLDACGKASVYMLASFPESIKDIARYQGSEVIEVRQPVSICPHASSIGEMGGWMRVKEQALVISTKEGSILLTGCAHPGILNIVERSKALTGADLLALIGGFHLHYTTSWIQKRVIMRLKQLEVRFVAPCHCSGDRARLLCQNVFGEGFIRCGVGQVIRSSSLALQ